MNQNGAGPAIACSDTMLNTHMAERVWKIKHESTFFINK